MAAKTLLILGGYGHSGFPIARLLLRFTEVRLILAGRALTKAQEAADTLNREFPGNRVQAAYADASDPATMCGVFNEADLVISASSAPQYRGRVAETALRVNRDYCDIHITLPEHSQLCAQEAAILQAGRCFILEAGFHPGMPAALARWAARRFDTLERADIGSIINPEGSLPLTESLSEIVALFRDYDGRAFRDGKWKKLRGMGRRDMRTFDFDVPFGSRPCVPMMLPEMEALPKVYPTLQDTGFYVAGSHWFTDWVVLPVIMLALKLAPRRAVKPMTRLLWWSMKKFAAPPYGTVLKLEADGVRNGLPQRIELTLHHEDAYQFTAIAVAACLRQYLDGSANRPGLWMMGHLVDPDRLLDDMEEMGVVLHALCPERQNTHAHKPLPV